MQKRRTKYANSQGDNAVIYARYSSHNQKDTSIEQQIEVCTKYARDNGYRITNIYADRAISGKTDARPQFRLMMQDAREHKFDVVISWKSSRLGRDMLDAMTNDIILRNLGIKCFYTEENFDDTAAGRFALRNMMNVNQFYIENMAEDILRGMRDNAKKCRVNNGSPPLGYRRGDDGKYEIVPEEAETVREIFTKVLAGMAFVDIANELNARGIKTKKGAPWGRSSFSRLLSNERYIGTYKWSDIVIENGMPAIIDREVFEMAQKKIKGERPLRRRHNENGDYLLTGKLFCGKCDSPMTGMSGTSKSGAKHHYYACYSARKDGSCDKKAVKRDWVEKTVALFIKEHVLRDEVIEWMVDQYMVYQKATFESQRIMEMRNQLKDVQSQLDNLVDAIARGMYTDSTKDKLLKLEADKKEIEQDIRLATYNLKEYDREHVRCYFLSFKEGSVESKDYLKRLFDQFVTKIYLYDDEIRIAFSGTKDDSPVSFKIIDEAEELAVSSVRLSSASSHQHQSGRTPELIMYVIGEVFVLVSRV